MSLEVELSVHIAYRHQVHTDLHIRMRVAQMLQTGRTTWAFLEVTHLVISK